MKTTDKSRAGALTEALIRKIATQYCEYDATRHAYNILRYECEEDFFNCISELLAASPVEQHEAAPADVLPIMRKAFRVTEIIGDPDPAKQRFAMRFSFPSIDVLHVADDEWNKFVAPIAQPEPPAADEGASVTDETLVDEWLAKMGLQNAVNGDQRDTLIAFAGFCAEWRRYESARASSPNAAVTFEDFRDRCEHYHGFKDDTDDTQCTCPGNNHLGSWCEESDCPRRGKDSSPNAAGAEGAKLDKPAKVGATRFGVGVKWSTVIGAAQRLYEYEVTPEKEAARIGRARSVLDDIRNGKYSSAPAQAAEPVAKVRVTHLGHQAELESYIARALPIGVHDLYAAPQSPAQADARPTDDELWDQTLRERDNYHEWADKLANAIAAHFGADIGEHSNVNNPWREALEAIESAAQADAREGLTDEQREVLGGNFGALEQAEDLCRATGNDSSADGLNALSYALRALLQGANHV